MLRNSWMITPASGFRKGGEPRRYSSWIADAKAIAAIASMVGNRELSAQYEQKAMQLKKLVQDKLWDPDACFFKISYEGHECQWNGPSWPFFNLYSAVEEPRIERIKRK